MSRVLQRGISGLRIHESSADSRNSQMKDRDEKEGSERSRHVLFLDSSKKLTVENNGFSSDSPNTTPSPRAKQHLMATLLLKLSLILILILALTESLLWTISITAVSRRNLFSGYRRLQEHLALDLRDIGDLSLAPSRLKEIEFCSQELENSVPCFNASPTSSNPVTRHCQPISKNCIVLPPVNYKVPLRWPTGRDLIWVTNVKITAQEVLSSGSLTKRMMMLDEEQISFKSGSLMFDGIEDYSHQIAEMIGLRNESNFIDAGIRIILDVGCGYGSFGAHLFSKNLATLCVANYEASGSQVQLTLERGLPAIVASFESETLPFPSLSFDMVHCARCGIDWHAKDAAYMIEADRVLRPGGYFTWTSPVTNLQGTLRRKANRAKWESVRDSAESLCWELLSQQDETVVWKKTTTVSCYSSRKSGSTIPVCDRAFDVESPHYRPLQRCIGGTHSPRWVSTDTRSTRPSYGVGDEIMDDMMRWNGAVGNYWSLLSPVIFSDHPKRPGDEDPVAPYNMVRNVMDMNACFGGFNAALLGAGKSAWVMNVVPSSAPDTLPVILDRGLVGVLHDWCEPFPSYPRTYDMVHAHRLFSLAATDRPRCSPLDLLIEVDRLLRPEGWVVLRDEAALIDTARPLTALLRWDARVVLLETGNQDKLLVCQKPFARRSVVAS